MSSLSHDNAILLFRVCSAILVTGVSVICFVVPGLIKEQSIRAFAFLHSLCSGVMLGMGFIVYILQSESVANFSFPVGLFLSSCSFISIVAMEHLSATSSYDYKPVSMIFSEESEVDDEGVELSMISEPNFNAVEDGNALEQHEDGNMPINHAPNSNVSHLKFYPNIVLSFASLFDFLGGIVLGFEEHTDFSNLVQYALTKALISLTFGTVLESLAAPVSIFQWFAFVFTLSSPFGILLGAYVIPQVLSTAFIMPWVYYCMGVVSALAAGVFLNIAVMNMIPAEIYSMGDEHNGRSSASLQDPSKVQREKILKLLAFVLGYALTIAPYYLEKYMIDE